MATSFNTLRMYDLIAVTVGEVSSNFPSPCDNASKHSLIALTKSTSRSILLSSPNVPAEHHGEHHPTSSSTNHFQVLMTYLYAAHLRACPCNGESPRDPALTLSSTNRMRRVIQSPRGIGGGGVWLTENYHCGMRSERTMGH